MKARRPADQGCCFPSDHSLTSTCLHCRFWVLRLLHYTAPLCNTNTHKLKQSLSSPEGWWWLVNGTTISNLRYPLQNPSLVTNSDAGPAASTYLFPPSQPSAIKPATEYHILQKQPHLYNPPTSNLLHCWALLPEDTIEGDCCFCPKTKQSVQSHPIETFRHQLSTASRPTKKTHILLGHPSGYPSLFQFPALCMHTLPTHPGLQNPVSYFNVLPLQNTGVWPFSRAITLQPLYSADSSPLHWIY